MRCLILECRDLARTQLQRQLDRFADTVCVGARPAAGQDDPWHGTSPDMVFLGSDQPGLERLLSRPAGTGEDGPVIVMMGDLPIHALTAFELQVTDFLLRPVETLRLEECLRRVRTELQQRRDLARVAILSETLAGIRQGHATDTGAPVYRDFWIRCRNETVRVPQSQIVWIEAARSYVHFNLRNRQLLHRISLRELEERLDPADFLRIHRSAIVNVHHIERTHADRHGTHSVELANGEMVRVGRKYRLQLAEFMASGRVPPRQDVAA